MKDETRNTLSEDGNEINSFDNSDSKIEDLELKNFHETLELQNENCNNYPQSSNNIHSNLSKCENCQIGPRIIASNVTIIDPDRDTSINIEDNIIKDYVKREIKPGNKGFYCQIGCKTCTKTRLCIKITFAVILVVFIIILMQLYIKFNNTKRSDNNNEIIKPETIISFNTAETNGYYTTSQNHIATETGLPENFTDQWFINHKEWSGKKQLKICEKNQEFMKNIKFWIDSSTCNTFNTCRSSLKADEVFDRLYCNYKDLSYHYAVSEQGVIFEGRSVKCDVPPEFRKCNESLLIIKLFIRDGIRKITSKHNETLKENFNKQIQSLNKLIKYNQNTGVLSNDSLIIDIGGFYGHDAYFKELNNTLGTKELKYFNGRILCPNFNTCKGL